MTRVPINNTHSRTNDKQTYHAASAGESDRATAVYRGFCQAELSSNKHHHRVSLLHALCHVFFTAVTQSQPKPRVPSAKGSALSGGTRWVYGGRLFVVSAKTNKRQLHRTYLTAALKSGGTQSQLPAAASTTSDSSSNSSCSCCGCSLWLRLTVIESAPVFV
jgi:hypothetical protein